MTTQQPVRCFYTHRQIKFSLIRLNPHRLPSVSCTFSCTMKYLVRDCDPNTGEPDDDGYDDEYVVRENPRAYGRPSLRVRALL